MSSDPAKQSARFTPEQLAAKNVPAVFASHPTLSLDPVPHLVLPDPFAEYCLTFYSPDDYDDLWALSIHPEIVPYLGPSGSHDPKIAAYVNWMDGWMKRENPELVFQGEYSEPMVTWGNLEWLTRPRSSDSRDGQGQALDRGHQGSTFPGQLWFRSVRLLRLARGGADSAARAREDAPARKGQSAKQHVCPPSQRR